MIPKTIHYCWFGGKPLPQEAVKCLNSWKQHMPDFEIIQWDESNYDISQYAYTKEMYEKKKWAFLTDFVRLDIVYKYGGIYFDVDVEVLRSFEPLLKYDGFAGMESQALVATGLGFGAVAKHPMLSEFMTSYLEPERNPDNGDIKIITCPILQTNILRKHGFASENKIQNIGGLEILTTEYLAPYDIYSGKMNITPNTYSIHHYSASWTSPWQRLKIIVKPFFYRTHLYDFMKKMVKFLGL